VTPKPITDLPASVRQRLLNRAKAERRPFNEIMQYYAMERFLYRLSKSVHAHSFVLKGALMLRIWRAPELRPTMDIDMLGMTSNDGIRIAGQIREIIAVAVEPDGLVFDAESIKTGRMTRGTDYEGVRVRFLGTLDSARINMQIDIGFGDTVFPRPEECELPTMLDSPAPKILCYSRETAIAEKFDAMLKHEELNSRMKDFYDIWLLCRHFNFEGDELAEAVRLTLERRGTELPSDIVAFTDDFATAQQVYWTAFLKRLKYTEAPESFAAVTSKLNVFLGPIALSISLRGPTPAKWAAPGPWA